MKKVKLFSVLTVAILVASSITFNSCKKDEDANDLTKNTDLELFEKIIQFKEKADYIVKNPYYKSGEEITLEEALFYLEATPNVVYGYNNLTPSTSETFTTIINFEAAENLSMDYVADKYAEIVETARDQYYSSSFESKSLSAVDIEFDADNPTQLSVTSIIRDRGPEIPEFDWSWYYGFEMGSCDGGPIKGDATDILEIEVTNYCYETPPENCFYHFYNVETIEINEWNWNEYINQNDEIPNDNYLDYKVYFASNEFGELTDEVQCLSSDVELPFYFSFYSYFSSYQAQYNNKKFKEIDVYESIKYGDFTELHHYLTVTIGDRMTICTNDPYPIPIGN